MNTRFSHFVSVACLAAGFTTTAWSQSTLYFDRGNFIGAAEQIPGNYQSISDFPWAGGPELTISDLTFRGSYLGLGPNGFLYNFDGSNPGLRIHFATGARAFGADFSSYLSDAGISSFTATVSLDTGETYQFTAPTDPNFAFFGFISPRPIMAMTFSDGGLFGFGNLHEELIGNIVVVTVPEPGALSLLAVGALLFGWRLRITSMP
ncbi:MAG: PEP-CTERM sorting domain-containing protein [Verrucomicrobiae bacterium]|nr:PEP-CTERM sorting domain-containing protein [Verrucomicrobiae bacterium]